MGPRIVSACLWYTSQLKAGMPSQLNSCTIDTDSVVEGQEVQGKLLAVGPGYVVGNDAPKGSGHSNVLEFGVVHFILVYKQKRYVFVRYGSMHASMRPLKMRRKRSHSPLWVEALSLLAR